MSIRTTRKAPASLSSAFINTLDDIIVPAYLNAVQRTGGEAEKHQARADCEAFIRHNVDVAVKAASRDGYGWEILAQDFWMSRKGLPAFLARPSLRDGGLDVKLHGVVRKLWPRHKVAYHLI